MFEEQVAAGAAWLDEEVGTHWPLLIDLSTLQMSWSQRCIIGQVFKLQENENYCFDDIAPQAFAEAHGFNLPSMYPAVNEVLVAQFTTWRREHPNLKPFDVLGELWAEEIKRRLDEGVKLDV
jgi:hypothetical protein